LGIPDLDFETRETVNPKHRKDLSASNLKERTRAMPSQATGTFDVKTTPLPQDEATGGPSIGRYALDKQYHGDLDAASKGEMLGAGNLPKGIAGYVAMEYVSGTLHRKKGSFGLQHTGTMDQGKFQLNVIVVPGSGIGELSGIAGTMTITIAAGKHSYDFEYTLPGSTQ
jgi:hypothetical protein